MRKYFKPSNIRKRDCSTKLEHPVSPWEVLRAYVVSSSGHLLWDDLCDLMSCINNKSVKQYLRVSGRLDSYAQSYTGTEHVAQVFVHRQVSSLLKKYPFRSSDLDIDPRDAAIDKWQQCEATCKDTNERLASLEVLPSWFTRARERAREILGDLTPEVIMKMITLGQHGPGSTLSSTGNRVSAYYKYADLPYSVTDTARVYAYAAISADHKWIDFLESTGRRTELPPTGSPRFQKELMLLKDVVDEVNSDKITFVPKDCRTDRPIAVGSSLNIFLQLGVKNHMEERLKSFGIDLTDQTKNQDFAFLGSKYYRHNDLENQNQFSTVDLASASDTISTELVRRILPSDWFAFLDDLRHKTGVLEGTQVTYEKFSAMGNGFTFPLESLIFYCICYGAIVDNDLPCTRNDIAVFGDDIIVRKKTIPFVLPALTWAGFSINTEKSFLQGPFKESCGTDYFRGMLVRPFYLKREVCSYADIYFCCNQINSKAIMFDFTTTLVSIYQALVELIPVRLRSYGPLSSGNRDSDLLGHSSSNSTHLSVPLGFLNNEGLRPWLSKTEETALRNSKLLKFSGDYQSAFAVFTTVSARQYRANSVVNYMLKLRNLYSPHDVNRYNKDLEIVDVTMATDRTSRRNATRNVMQVLPVLNWNGALSLNRQNKSLIYFI